VTFVEAFAAWALSRVLGSIPITPGGVGFVDLGLTGVLVAFGAHNTEAVAATLIYRFLTTIPIIVLGFLAVGTWRSVGSRLPPNLGRDTESRAGNTRPDRSNGSAEPSWGVSEFRTGSERWN
jgi:Lysylphosphatidylglycerol synthase TM region